MRNENIFLKERVLYIDNEEILSYKNGHLIYRNNEITRHTRIGGFLNKFSLIERLLRKEPRCAAKVNKNHFLISYDGNVLCYSPQHNSVSVEHKFNKGMNNPLEFLVFENPETNEKEVIYGEYIWNDGKGPVSIYRRKNNLWKEVYSFDRGKITHIHNIVYDKYRHGYLILTGDDDQGSGIWFAEMDFSIVKPILVGSQQYRSCVAFPTQEGIYYATDTPLEQNYIYYVKLNDQMSPLEIIPEYKLDGSCIYGCEKSGAMYFSTTVEPDSSLPKWRYRFTYKLGKGICSRSSSIIKRDTSGKYTEIASFKKDIMPIWLFQFGNVLFPKNDGKCVYGVLQSTRAGHSVTVLLEKE